MPGDLDSFMEEVRAESKAEGPEAVAELQMFQAQYQLARQLFGLRRARGWTQQQFAARSSVQQSEISRIERGEGNPTFRTLIALARALDVRLDFVGARVSEDAGAWRLAVAARRTRTKRPQSGKSGTTKRQPVSGARKSASSPRKRK